MCTETLIRLSPFVIAMISLASACTHSKPLVQPSLERFVDDAGYTLLSTPEHSVTPGALISVVDHSVSVICTWPAVYTDLPQTSENGPITPTRPVTAGLESWARSQPLIKALGSYYSVTSVSFGPITETRIDLNRSRPQVSDRCAQAVRDDTYRSAKPDAPPLLVEAILATRVQYRLAPTSDKVASIVRPVVPDLAKAFGDFTFRPEENVLEGRLVLGYKSVALSMSDLGIPATNTVIQPRLAATPSLAGVWSLAHWSEQGSGVIPRFSVPRGAGALTVTESNEINRYTGVLTINLSGGERVVENLDIHVDGERVRAKGKVIKGRWTDDSFTLSLRGTNQLVGTAQGPGGGLEPATVRFVRSDLVP